MHATPLSYHFKDKHLWFDVVVLISLFVVASYYPLFKIVPLVASLELFSFFSFHLLAKRSRLQLQGFLGGFVSSTAVYLQMLNSARFASIESPQLVVTLLLAISAMLIECLVIMYFLAEEVPMITYIPFVAQLIFFASVAMLIHVFLIKRAKDSVQNDSQVAYSLDAELVNDHPIVWMTVAKLSLFIFVLIAVMHFIGNELGLSRDFSTLLVALFEAHAILVSVITEWSMEPSGIDLLKLIFLILLGNTLSKSYLVYRSKNLTTNSESHSCKTKWLFIGLLLGGLVFSLVVTFGWQQVMLS